MILYYRPTCPYCVKVLNYVKEKNIALELRDIAANSQFAHELIIQGGKQQVPFLVDEEKGVKMYESSDIIAYLAENHE